MEAWSLRDHFIPLTLQAIKSSSLLFKDSFSPSSKNSLRKEDREGISILNEKQGSLKESFWKNLQPVAFDGKIQLLAYLAMAIYRHHGM